MSPAPFRHWLPLALALLLVGCAGGPMARPLRIGVAPDYPPVVFEHEGEIVGLEADLARLVGDALGRRITFHRSPFEGLIPALLAGEIDLIMSGMSINMERASKIRFAASYLRVGQMALIRRNDVAWLGRRGALGRGGVRVGFQTATIGEQYTTRRLRAAVPFGFRDADAAIAALRAGDIDAVIHDAPTIWRVGVDPYESELMGLYDPLTSDSLAWAVRPDDLELARELDALVAKWRSEGLIDELVDAWIPVRVQLR